MEMHVWSNATRGGRRAQRTRMVLKGLLHGVRRKRVVSVRPRHRMLAKVEAGLPLENASANLRIQLSGPAFNKKGFLILI